jgi:hypothetical protein
VSGGVLVIVVVCKLLVAIVVNGCMLLIVSVESENVADVDVVLRVVVLVIVERVVVVVVGNREGSCGSKCSSFAFRIVSIHSQ